MTKPKSKQSFKRLKKTKKKEKLKKEKAKLKSLRRRADNSEERRIERQTVLLEKEIEKETRRVSGTNPTTYRKPKD